MSIVGLGGTGKTQVALQFAYEVKEAQLDWSIFWVAAVSMESFEQACAGIVQALRIPQRGEEEDDPKELVKHYLSSSQARRWLLVVDNADDPDILFGSEQSQGIVDYLPESEQAAVVYTTRTPEVAELTCGDVIELGAMSRQDATDFFTKSLVRRDLLRDDAATAKLLDELLDELTDLPLAIAQAAAYLNKNRMSISKYMQLLRSTEEDLVCVMSREFRDNTRYKGSANAVVTTWVVSFSQIRKHDAVAAKLLEFISCVEWKAIPQSLLPSAESEARVEEAIGTLCGYSFLARRDRDDTAGSDDNEEWFDVHRKLIVIATVLCLITQYWVSSPCWGRTRVIPTQNNPAATSPQRYRLKLATPGYSCAHTAGLPKWLRMSKRAGSTLAAVVQLGRSHMAGRSVRKPLVVGHFWSRHSYAPLGKDNVHTSQPIRKKIRAAAFDQHSPCEITSELCRLIIAHEAPWHHGASTLCISELDWVARDQNKVEICDYSIRSSRVSLGSDVVAHVVKQSGLQLIHCLHEAR
ncbi:hypothetical protein OPT61_g8496 [Boeremia exigua]|uniref:Uncharacterized protein n=1 Tax=Boeremia exigua TaxID=749465 RepID=A0ACC2HYG9_9PLEO|nr:hypothetical protein OPT61_g8496 [Boeremia exigua]